MKLKDLDTSKTYIGQPRDPMVDLNIAIGSGDFASAFNQVGKLTNLANTPLTTGTRKDISEVEVDKLWGAQIEGPTQ